MKPINAKPPITRRFRLHSVRSLSILCLLLNSAVFVGSQPVFSFSERRVAGGFGGIDQVQGWEFVPQIDLTVTHLGLYDGRMTGGFQQQHSVAIWDVDRNLVTSANLPAGESAQLIGSFRYVDISPMQLHAGTTYVIAAFLPGPVNDYTVLWDRASLTNGAVLLDSRIEFVAYRGGPSPNSISFPEMRDEEYVGGFGPNFIIAVPEPSAFALLSMMITLSGLWAFRRRKTKHAA